MNLNAWADSCDRDKARAADSDRGDRVRNRAVELRLELGQLVTRLLLRLSFFNHSRESSLPPTFSRSPPPAIAPRVFPIESQPRISESRPSDGTYEEFAHCFVFCSRGAMFQFCCTNTSEWIKKTFRATLFSKLLFSLQSAVTKLIMTIVLSDSFLTNSRIPATQQRHPNDHKE